MKITHDLAANYIKFIDKALKIADTDKIDAIDINGNKVSVYVGELRRLSKESRLYSKLSIIETERKYLISQTNQSLKVFNNIKLEVSNLTESLNEILNQIDNNIIDAKEVKRNNKRLEQPNKETNK